MEAIGPSSGAGRLGLLALKLIVPGNHGLGEVVAAAIVALAQGSTGLDSRKGWGCYRRCHGLDPLLSEHMLRRRRLKGGAGQWAAGAM